MALTLNKQGKEIHFGIITDNNIQAIDGTMLKGGHCKCPFCLQVTHVDDIRRAGQTAQMGERMVAVIAEGKSGKDYRQIEDTDLQAYKEAEGLVTSDKPQEFMPHFRNINLDLYGLLTWGSLFNSRQLLAMQTFVECLHKGHNGDEERSL